MSQSVEDFSKADLMKIIQRDRQTKEMMAQRVAGLVLENTELLSVIRELQAEAANHTHDHEGNGPASHQHDEPKVSP